MNGEMDLGDHRALCRTWLDLVLSNPNGRGRACELGEVRKEAVDNSSGADGSRDQQYATRSTRLSTPVTLSV